MALKIDFHVHTKASKDGVSSIQEIVVAAKNRGLDGFAITDHDVAMSPKKAEVISEESGIIVLPGIEVSTRSGHLILLCPENELPKNPTLMEVLEIAKHWNSPVIIPHPMDHLSHGLGEVIIRSIHQTSPAIEVFNASTFFVYNKKAKRVAKELGLYEVGGSDAHVASAVGCAYTIVDAEERTCEGVIGGLRSGKTRAFGAYMSITSLFELSLRRLLKKSERFKNNQQGSKDYGD